MRYSGRRAFVAGSGATLAGILRSPAKAAQFEFKAGASAPANQPTTRRLAQMWTAIEQESGGRIRTQFFPNSLLGSETAMFSQLRLGAINFMHLNGGTLSSIVPVADISGIGFVFKDAEEGLRIHDGPVGTYVRQEIATKGLYIFPTFWNAGMLVVSSSTVPIRAPSDLHGFKIRVAGGRIQLDLFKTLGASPVGISVAEAYTALQTKLVDGEASAVTTIESGKIYEVQKYISLTNHQWSGFWLSANGDTWKSLPPDLQEIVESNNKKYALQAMRDAKFGDPSVVAQLKQQGIAFNPVDQVPFRTLLRPYYQFWATTFGPTLWTDLQNSLGRRLI